MVVNWWTAWPPTSTESFTFDVPVETVPDAIFPSKDADRARSLSVPVQTVGYDRWGANDVTRKAGEAGMTMVAVGQGFAALSAPLKELLRLTLVGRLRHGGRLRELVLRMAGAGGARDRAGDAA